MWDKTKQNVRPELYFRKKLKKIKNQKNIRKIKKQS